MDSNYTENRAELSILIRKYKNGQYVNLERIKALTDTIKSQEAEVFVSTSDNWHKEQRQWLTRTRK